MIKINNLTIKYHNQILFEKLNLNIVKGDYFAIVGENGIGKSSLIKTIINENKSFTGEILIDNIPNTAIKKWNKIGYVPQINQIKHDIPITVQEYLNLYVTDQKLFDRLKDEFEINDFLEKPLNKLSGGQFQRTNLVKSLSQKIDFLILDEPTTGLDTTSREFLYNHLHELNKKGITILIISHNIEELKGIHKIYNLSSKKLERIADNDCRYCQV